MEKELYIIRHGETDLNRKSIIQGRGVDADINENGRLQARSFYNYYKHLEFDILFTSTLKRTHQTVDPFIRDGIPWRQHTGLDELDWGVHEGKSTNRVMRDGFRKLQKAWESNRLDVKIEGGESPLELQHRQQIFITDMEQLDHSRVLICSHGRAMRSLLCTLLGIELSKMNDFPHGNLSLYKLNKVNGLYSIDLFNSRDHLL